MQKNENRAGTDHQIDDSHSRLALHWYGFGSPVGLGILAISIGIAAVLVRVALIGFH
jgi:hypothetical protein